jgi:hypothetical protein
MNLTHYRGLRAKGMIRSKAMALSGVEQAALIKRSLHWLGLLLIIAALMIGLINAASAQLQVSEAGAESRALRADIERLEKTVVACLNGLPIKVSGEWFLCSAAPSGYKVK